MGALCNSTGKNNYLESSAMPEDPNCEDGVQPRFFTVYQRASVMRPPFGSDELPSALQQDFMEHEDIVRRGGLVFDSRFECGNLAKATLMRAQRGHQLYHLLVSNDTNSNGHTQWFFFSVEGAIPGVEYEFQIRNFSKKDS